MVKTSTTAIIKVEIWCKNIQQLLIRGPLYRTSGVKTYSSYC